MAPDNCTGVSIKIRIIGMIRTPFFEASGTPIQPAYGACIEGEVCVDESYATALEGIEGFDRIWLIYWMDRAGSFKPRVVPYRDTQEYGLFATRSPNRPNPIGISVVRLLRREGCVLHVSDVDILDGTPLLDLKPYRLFVRCVPRLTGGMVGPPGRGQARCGREVSRSFRNRRDGQNRMMSRA